MEWAHVTARAAPRPLAGALKRLGLRPYLSPTAGVFVEVSDDLFDRLSRLNPAASPSADWPEPLPDDADPVE